jgi:hypothetical protein
MPAKKSTKNSLPVQSNNSESENDSTSSDEEVITKTVQLAKVTKPKIKAEPIDDDSEDVEETKAVSDNETESESDSDNQDKKLKEKKLKESFDELSKKFDILQLSHKSVDKEILEINKLLKSKEKIRNDIERQQNSILKLLFKTHSDEVIKARKEKPKKTKKNLTNYGILSLQPVPEILIKFLDLNEEEKCLTRPSVMSKLSNKFVQLGLKKGQNTTLTKEVVKELELDKSYIDKVIKFTEFQTFLKGFYPTKEEKNTVSVN